MKSPTLQRVDIQALRGLAVLLVVFYHAKLGPVAAGYLGVDIFFVISGYLITQLVGGAILRGDFSFKDFYVRRARRLLPAAYVTFAATALAAPWFLNQLELRDFQAQLLGGLTFTANVVLWQQSGYFEGASDLKPLLHLWSLSIEEQYYFLLPAALVMLPRRQWLAGTIALALLSLCLCIAGTAYKPVATFYLLPTRAWEMLTGSAGALLVLRGQGASFAMGGALRRLLLPAALVCLLILPFNPLPGDHPGLNAVLVCLSTLAIILCNSRFINGLRVTAWLGKVGDFSYSLYLAHWPVIAFTKNAWIGDSNEVALPYRIATLVLSFALGYALYRYVENPWRHAQFKVTRGTLAKTALCSLLLLSMAPAIGLLRPAATDFSAERQHNFGFSSACDSTAKLRTGPQCANQEQADLLVWGDSFAMHLVPGLSASWTAGGVRQATMSACVPVLGLSSRHLARPDHGNYRNAAWARDCIAFNDSVIDYLKLARSVRVVVLSSPFSQMVAPNNHVLVTSDGNGFAERQVEMAHPVERMRQTIEAIRALGKKVVIVAPPPSSGFDIGACLERRQNHAVAIGGHPHCLVGREAYRAHWAREMAFLDAVAGKADIGIIRFDSFLCAADYCRTTLDGALLYRDAVHFSIKGSKLVAERIGLAALVQAQAR